MNSETEKEINDLKVRIKILENALLGIDNSSGLISRVSHIEKTLSSINEKLIRTEGILKGLGLILILFQVLEKIFPLFVNKY